MPKGHSENSPQLTKAVDKRVQAVELRKQGLTYQRIADKMGLPGASSAHALVKVAMAELREQCLEDTSELRQMDLERLDRMFLQAQQHVRNPKTGPAALSAMVKILARRAAMLGYDAPTKVDSTVTFQKLYAISEASPDVFPPAPGEVLEAVALPAHNSHVDPIIAATKPLDQSENREPVQT